LGIRGKEIIIINIMAEKTDRIPDHIKDVLSQVEATFLVAKEAARKHRAAIEAVKKGHVAEANKLENIARETVRADRRTPLMPPKKSS
jgi:hypothetical protein